MKNIKLTSLQEREKTIVHVGHVTVGEGFCVIAGPCSVESEQQTVETAKAVKECGADMLREELNQEHRPMPFRVLG
jgi:3-deoxy-7-phosphoheptulonate synthase